jgi:hypothetical protein
VTSEHPEDARATRLAEIRAKRGTPERLAKIAELEAQQPRRKSPKPSASHRKTPENSTHMFGHPWPEWFEMRDAAFDFLCLCAAERRLGSYGEIWTRISNSLGKDLGNHWRQLPYVLGYVSTRSVEEFDLLATALVIYDPDDAESGPGPGFFRLAASLGVLDDSDAPLEGTEWSMTDRQRTFWRQQVDAMFDRFSAR